MSRGRIRSTVDKARNAWISRGGAACRGALDRRVAEHYLDWSGFGDARAFVGSAGSPSTEQSARRSPAMQALLRNIRTDGFWSLQGEVFFGLFDAYIEFAVQDEAPLEYVERCAEYLNSLGDELITDFCLACIRYRDDHLYQIGAEIEELRDPRDVLKLVHPSTLIVPDPQNGDEPVVHMELQCDWDEEHGIEWIVRRDRLLYVGGFDGQSPWSDHTGRHSGNYA